MDKIFNLSTVVFTAFQLAIVWALVAHTGEKKTQRIISVILCVMLAVAFVATNPAKAYAEEGRVGTVVIVYYDDDIYILEWDDGQRDVFLGRGDLMPGDKLLVWGPEYEDMELIEQSNWNFFDYLIEGEPAASFLYPEDAKEVMEEALRGFPIFLFYGHYNSGVVQPQKEVCQYEIRLALCT